MKIALRTLLGIALLGSTAACTMQPEGNGYRVGINPMGALMGNQQPQPGGYPQGRYAQNPQHPYQPAVAPPGRGGPVMQFRGRMGGGTGEVSLREMGNGIYYGEVSASVPGGAGEVKGDFQRRADTFVMVRPHDVAPCELTMTLRGRSLQVQEGNCSYYHGARVEFIGVLPRVR